MACMSHIVPSGFILLPNKPGYSQTSVCRSQTGPLYQYKGYKSCIRQFTMCSLVWPMAIINTWVFHVLPLRCFCANSSTVSLWKCLKWFFIIRRVYKGNSQMLSVCKMLVYRLQFTRWFLWQSAFLSGSLNSPLLQNLASMCRHQLHSFRFRYNFQDTPLLGAEVATFHRLADWSTL